MSSGNWGWSLLLGDNEACIIHFCRHLLIRKNTGEVRRSQSGLFTFDVLLSPLLRVLLSDIQQAVRAGSFGLEDWGDIDMFFLS